MRYTHLLILSQMVILFVGCNQAKIDDLSKKNDSLQTEIKNAFHKLDSLSQENVKLKETADYHFRHGVDLNDSNKYEEARKEFEVIIDKFPSHSLVKEAHGKIKEIDVTVAQIEREREKQELEKRAKMSAAEKRNAMPLVSGTDVVVDPQKYINHRVRMRGTVYVSNDRVTLSQERQEINVDYSNLSQAKRRELLSMKPNYPLEVWGVINCPGCALPPSCWNTGQLFIEADFIQ